MVLWRPSTASNHNNPLSQQQWASLCLNECSSNVFIAVCRYFDGTQLECFHWLKAVLWNMLWYSLRVPTLTQSVRKLIHCWRLAWERWWRWYSFERPLAVSGHSPQPMELFWPSQPMRDQYLWHVTCCQPIRSSPDHLISTVNLGLVWQIV